MPLDDAPRCYPQTRAAWRQWLQDNADQAGGIWVIYDRGPLRELGYAEIVEEALCFGWIDSLGRGLSDTQTMLYVTRRKPTSKWSRVNKDRVDRLLAAGMITAAGQAAIDTAQANGTWTALDDVENLVEPDELRTALAADPKAQENWNAFPRSAKRAILEWLLSAKRPETRRSRIATIVGEAAFGRRANSANQRQSPPTVTQ